VVHGFVGCRAFQRIRAEAQAQVRFP
jgi:hypothetical protein